MLHTAKRQRVPPELVTALSRHAGRRGFGRQGIFDSAFPKRLNITSYSALIIQSIPNSHCTAVHSVVFMVQKQVCGWENENKIHLLAFLWKMFEGLSGHCCNSMQRSALAKFQDDPWMGLPLIWALIFVTYVFLVEPIWDRRQYNCSENIYRSWRKSTRQHWQEAGLIGVSMILLKAAIRRFLFV
jgi:hypothetical protein